MRTEKEIRAMLKKTPMISNLDLVTRNVLKWVLGEFDG